MLPVEVQGVEVSSLSQSKADGIALLASADDLAQTDRQALADIPVLICGRRVLAI
jgi:hypothetical protein